MGEKLEITSKVYLSPFAITRAEQRLYLTCAGYRMLFGKSNFNSPSRFLNEISEELTELLADGNGMSVPFAQAPKPKARRPAVKRPAYNESGGEKMQWKPGDKASHKIWGTGTVVSVKGSADDMELDIAFPNPVGIKRLLAKFAPIEKE